MGKDGNIERENTEFKKWENCKPQYPLSMMFIENIKDNEILHKACLLLFNI